MYRTLLTGVVFCVACSGGSNGVAIDAPAGGDAALSDGAASDGATGDGALPVDGAGPVVDGAVALDPGGPGRFDSLVTAEVRVPISASATVAATVCAPAAGTTPAPGPFPLVVISPGYQLARSQYRIYCEHLATWGYVAIVRDYGTTGNHQAKAAEVGKVIDWALGAASGLAARIDPTRIAAAGHSMGGKVSINAAILDARIRAVVGWDPVDALPPFNTDNSASVTPELMAGLTVPLAVLGELGDSTGGIGGMSCAPAAENYQRYYATACHAAAALEVTIADADHMDWIGDRSTCGLACFACSSGTTPDATVHTITARVTTAWLERHLRGDVTADSWLVAPAIGAPVTVRAGVPACP